MIKKNLSFIVLLMAAFALWFIKSHQRSAFYNHPHSQTTTVSTLADSIAAIPGTAATEDFNRQPDKIIYSKHAHCRMECRHIDEAEVKEILKTGKVNNRKIESDDRGKTYPLEGVAEGHHLRIVFAPKAPSVVEVVTCIDLDTDWECDCN